MPIVWQVFEGEGVRIDGTDVWILKRIMQDGTAAEMLAPDGSLVVLEEDIAFRVGPGFRMWVMPGAPKGSVRLAMEAYVPVMHRHPPRNHKPGAAGGRPA